MNRSFPEEEIQMANKEGKDMSSQLIKRGNETPPFAYHISKSQRNNVQCQ